jgi:hypothetical protein
MLFFFSGRSGIKNAFLDVFFHVKLWDLSFCDVLESCEDRNNEAGWQ